MIDPSKYGAKRANPAQYGARPATATKKAGYFSRVKDSFNAGKEKVKKSLEGAEGIKNPLQLFERSLKLGAGVIEAASSPLTAAAEPVIRPTVGKLIEKTGEEIAKSEKVQRFADSKAGKITERVAQDVTDLTTIASTVAGPKILKTGVARTTQATKTAVTNAVDQVPAKLESALSESYRKILNPTARQSSIEARFGKDTPAFLAKERIRLRVKDGKLDPTEAIETLHQTAEVENPLFKTLLRSESKYFDLDELGRMAKTAVRAKGTDRTKALAHIDAELAAYKAQFEQFGAVDGNRLKLPLDYIDEIKKDLWSKTRGFGTPDADVINDTNFIFGRAAQRAIETSVTDTSVRTINRRLGDIAAATRLLEKRAGMPVQGGRLNKYFSRLTGAVAGSAHGPFASIVGALTAEKLAGVLQDAQLPAHFKLYLIDTLRGSKKGSTIVQQMEQRIRQRAEELINRKALPEPSVIIPPAPHAPNINPQDPTLGGRL